MSAAVRDLAGYDRGERGWGVRDVVLGLPSVGCTNRTVELLARAEPRIRPITHQHGCAQIGDDVGITAEVLARVCAHPNVRAAVIIGLGCETNQSARLLERARARGARVERGVLQELGGIEPTIAAMRELTGPLLARPALRSPMPAGALTVGLLADSEAGEAGARLRAATAAALEACGVHVLEAVYEAGGGDQPVGPLERAGVPWAWTRRRLPVMGGDLPLAIPSDVERLTSLAVRGAQVCVFFTGRASPLGSPFVPVVKVGLDQSYAPLVPGVLDLVAGDEDAEQVVAAVLSAAGGEAVAAERAGQRDFGIPRLGPSM